MKKEKLFEKTSSKRSVMLKKIILGIFLLFSFAFAGEKTDYDLVDTFLKDGKYYIKGTERLYTGYIEYVNSETKVKTKEENYKDGVMVQEREYYESGTLKSVIRYADGEPYLEEKFFEDGTLCERIFRKDGTGKYVYIKSDDTEDIYTPDGRTKISCVAGMTFKQDVKDDIFRKTTELYHKEYDRTELTEKNSTDEFSVSRKWNYGILVYEDIYRYNKNGETTKEIFSYSEDNIMRKEDENSIREYFPNGNQKYERIIFRDKEGKKHDEERYYDESGKMLSEEIEINSETIKSDLQNYKKYCEMIKDDKPYKILYPNGKTAYEKYFTDKNIKMEKYYTKERILVLEQESSPEPYEIKIKKSTLGLWDEYEGKIKRDIKIVKKYTPKGQPVYIEKFEDNDKYTIFETTSYHENGKIYYNKKETITKKNAGNAEVVCELKRYNENGKLEYLLTFDSQRKDEKYYDKEGNIYYEIIMETINYAAGQERESHIAYYKNGKVRRESITNWDGNEEDLISSKIERIYSINGDLKKESKE